jgi:hypothetical protein
MVLREILKLAYNVMSFQAEDQSLIQWLHDGSDRHAGYKFQSRGQGK